MAYLSPAELARFTAKTRWRGKCLEWTGYRQSDGYGRVTVRNTQWKAHRLAYRDAWGEIPPGKLIRHTCDNPACVNPAHLRLGTDADNYRDRIERDRTGLKIKAADARSILRDERTYREIAKDYSISPASVCLIKKRRTWQHIGE